MTQAATRDNQAMPEPSPAPPSPAVPPAPLPTTLPQAKRLFGQWWRRQSPARQDRFATLGPLLSVLLFLAAIISAFWYLRNEEVERETESLKRDTEIVQQQLRLVQFHCWCIPAWLAALIRRQGIVLCRLAAPGAQVPLGRD